MVPWFEGFGKGYLWGVAGEWSCGGLLVLTPCAGPRVISTVSAKLANCWWWVTARRQDCRRCVS